MFLLEMTCPTVDVSESSSVADAVTWTESVTAPGFSLKSMRATWSTSSLISGRSDAPNPACDAEILYRPTGSRLNEKAPDSLLCASRRRPVSRFEIASCAPTMTASLASVTIPLTVAVCAKQVEKGRSRASPRTQIFTVRMAGIVERLAPCCPVQRNRASDPSRDRKGAFAQACATVFCEAQFRKRGGEPRLRINLSGQASPVIGGSFGQPPGLHRLSKLRVIGWRRIVTNAATLGRFDRLVALPCGSTSRF